MGTTSRLGLNVRFLFSYCLFSIFSLLFCFLLHLFSFQDLTKHLFGYTILEVPFFIPQKTKKKRAFAFK